VIELALTEGLRPIFVDQTQIRQVLANLTVNASDAMPDGGTLTIRTDHAPLCHGPEDDSTVIGPMLRVSVTDTGVGIDRTVLPRIFEPFFTTKERSRGTGLGLATTHGIVLQSGGDIRVQSKQGRGTTFDIFLPCTHKLVTSRETKPLEIVSGGQETILLVDDEAGICELVNAILTEQGYCVLTAPNAEAALDLIEKQEAPIDLLISDVVMPGIDGLELHRRLPPPHQGVAAIFMSGQADVIAESTQSLPPGTSFLQKPFDPSDVTQAVRQALDQALLAEAAPASV
jgi:two-component system cell cycle sensor histidine kinase/response regulator CckA